MDSFEITGPGRIEGNFTPKGNKNAALPMIAAACLTDDEVILRNVPKILDVENLIELLRLSGAKCEWTEGDSLRIEAGNLNNFDLNPDICSKIRASILLAGPFLARNGWVRFPPPGGDVIGRRRLDTHFSALESMGVEIKWDGTRYLLKSGGRLKGDDIFLDEPSVTGTENILMAASLAEGRTVIRNAACEPHVQDLCGMLSKMGSEIKGVSTNRLEIKGRRKLKGTDAGVGPDYIEIGSVIALAALSGGEVRIQSVKKEDVEPILISFRKLGIETVFKNGCLAVPKEQKLKVQSDFGEVIPTVSDGPWPGFPADLTSIALVAATRSEGTVLIFEKMFESRMFFVDKLVSMGAKIVLCDPHRAVVTGPSKLRAQYMSSPDIRAGMALLIAASIAEGKSVISNAHQIDRGYERIDERLGFLGLDIKRI